MHILSMKCRTASIYFLLSFLNEFILITENSFTMNTKKVFFGLMAIAFLAMAAVSTNVVNVEESQETSIEKSRFKKL